MDSKNTIMLYLGEETFTKDDKGRVNIPSKFRKILMKRNQEFKNESLVSKFGDYENCMVHISCIETPKGNYILCSSIPDFYKKENQYIDLVLTDYDRMKVHKMSTIVSFDKQGRILIPKRFVNAASLEDKVVFTGNGDSFNIWNPELEKESYQNE